MAAERKEQVIAVGIGSTGNGRSLTLNGRRQPSCGDTSRMNREELEPISKSFEEHNEAGKLDKAEEIVGVVLPTNEDPALPLKPGEEALDEPASHVAA